jgi:hypothetical protein
MIGTMAPTTAPLEVADLQEKWRTAPGADAFGGRDELDCLSSPRTYCHNGGMVFAHYQTASATEITDERRATPEGSIGGRGWGDDAVQRSPDIRAANRCTT